MSTAPDDRAGPVPAPALEGEVIGRSVGKTMALVFFCALFATFGFFITLSQVRPADPDQVRSKFLLVLGPCLLLMPTGFALYLLHLLRVRRRLVITDDRLQVVEAVRGADRVVVQIPFENIDSMKFESDVLDKIGLNFVDLNHPLLYVPSHSYELAKTSGNYHYSLGGGYRLNLKTIHEQLRRAYERATGRRMKTPPPPLPSQRTGL